MFHKLTSAYEKLNDETLEFNQKLVQMMNETLGPGIGAVDEYNECMKSTARTLIDYGLDQLIEHIDDDENEPSFD
ncbi:unnamed protein product [Rotaria sp. Silwood2]|nr:unnamed protein product [Rotaria sp. Silwood2]CAF2586970.1 unnamed protein product [Rotaria sp. Silwood2]CAF2836268.1 unnamed protein product [Rotaria sp. Silwood2]CAF3860430.1 unnamed protein product [Rotaria sp. Silwood2]CAF3917817.1 unnamed protein product [Rotaria sp. Silwood2]